MENTYLYLVVNNLTIQVGIYNKINVKKVEKLVYKPLDDVHEYR